MRRLQNPDNLSHHKIIVPTGKLLTAQHLPLCLQSWWTMVCRIAWQLTCRMWRHMYIYIYKYLQSAKTHSQFWNVCRWFNSNLLEPLSSSSLVWMALVGLHDYSRDLTVSWAHDVMCGQGERQPWQFDPATGVGFRASQTPTSELLVVGKYGRIWNLTCLGKSYNWHFPIIGGKSELRFQHQFWKGLKHNTYL